MGVNPGNLAFSMPPAEDDMVRKQRDMERQVRENAASVPRSFETTVAYLTSLTVTATDEFTVPITGFTGFYDGGRPSVTISSPTGRLDLSFGGALNGGDSFFCYSIAGATSGTLISRESVLANPARRVAISGGASFAPSGWKSIILDVPADEVLTVTLELNADSGFAFFFGGSIIARVAP